MIKVLQITTGLNYGGAENMLLRLLRHADRSKFSFEVLSLGPTGPLEREIRNLGVPVEVLNLERSWRNIFSIPRIVRSLQKKSIDVMHSWLHHSNIIALAYRQMGGKARTIWSLHQCNFDADANKRLTLWLARIQALASTRSVDRVIASGEAAKNAMVSFGFSPENIVSVPNGFELDVFKPIPGASVALRQELNLPKDSQLIGLIARYDPQKDFDNFFKAAKILVSQNSQVYFVLVGQGITELDQGLMRELKHHGLVDRCKLLGIRSDMPRVFSGLNLATLASKGEAFPLVIGEAMACGTPCVATDVGDTRDLIGDTGIVVPRSNPSALAEAWSSYLRLPSSEREIMGQRARSRISINYDISLIVKQYEGLYSDTYGVL